MRTHGFRGITAQGLGGPALALAVTISLAAAATAPAATVSRTGSVVTLQAGPGEINRVTVKVSSFGTPELMVSDGTTRPTAGSGCTIGSPEYAPNDAYCGTGVARVRLLLGDGDDSAMVESTVPATTVTEIDLGPGGAQGAETFSDGPVELTGGPGRDTFVGYGEAANVISTGEGDDDIIAGFGNDTVDAGPGADQVRGAAGADSIQGGDGDDLIFGDDGEDTIAGGEGNDNLWGERHADTLFGDGGDDQLHDDGSHETGYWSGDVLQGGPGLDTADYGSRGGTTPVDISLDGQANDGATGEADNVGPAGDVERVEGTGNDDVLTGSDRADELWGGWGNDRIDGLGGDDLLEGFDGNDQIAGGDGNDTLDGLSGDDSLLGEAGNDRLWGYGGNDTMRGGAGADAYDAGTGDDVVLARDGEVDEIRCSFGSDTVEADGNDQLLDAGECERVLTQSGSSGSGGLQTQAAGVQRIAAVRRSGIALKVTAPEAGRLVTTATIARRPARRLRLAASKRVVIGRAETTMSAQGSRSVRVKLTRKAKRGLKRARSVKVKLRTTFTSATGARTTSVRTVRLRR